MATVKLEIFLENLTKNGFRDMKGDLTSVEAQTNEVIAALKRMQEMQLKEYNKNKSAGMVTDKELADIQALQGMIRGMEDSLQDLKNAKEQVAATPIDKGVDADVVARKMNNLKMSFSQVARELPSLTMGPQMFFLAISNNLPMLSDAIADVRKQNELLRASGQKAVPVWKQLGSALFSWQTALVAGISLFIVYGREISDWVKGLFNGSKATDLTADATERLNKAINEGRADTQKEITQLQVLYTAATDSARGMDERKRAVKELKDEYPDYFSKLDNETILTGNAADAYQRLTENIIASSKARASMKFLDENNAKIIELEREIADLQTKKKVADDELTKRSQKRNTIDREAYPDLYAAAQMNVGAQLTRVKEIDKAISERQDQVKQLNVINNELTKNINIEDLLEDKTGGKGKGTTTKKDYATELAEARLRAQQTVERLRIEVMKDAYEQRRALAQQEYKESIAEIDKQEKQTINTMNEARKAGENISAGEYDQVRKNATQQRLLQQSILNDKLIAIDREYYDKASDSMIAYQKEYGNYYEKRAAIAAEYTKKILQADTEGERMSLQRKFKEAINELNFDQMKSEIDFSKVFGNIDIQSTEALKTLQDKLSKYITNAAKDLSAEDLKELQDALKAIDAELLERNPFETLKERACQMVDAAKELQKAKEDLERVQAGENVVSGYRPVTNEQGEVIRIEKTYLSATEALKKYNKAKENSEESSRNYIKAEEEAKKQIDKLASSISEIGNVVGGEAGEILTLIGSITTFATSSIDGITKVAQAGANAMSAVEKASVILGIVSTAIQVLQKANDLIGDSQYKQYEKNAEKYQEINKLTNAVNDYRIAVAEARAEENNWFGGSGLQSLKDFKKVQEEVMKAYNDVLYAQQATYVDKKGGDWILGPLKAVMAYGSMVAPFKGWRELWGYGEGQEGVSAAVDNLRFETQAAKKGFLGIGKKDQKTVDLRDWVRDQGWGELFDENGLIDTGIAQELLNNYSDKLVGETKATLEQLVELRENYDEYIEQLHEYVASMYEPLVDNFVSGIWDWFDEGKSALDSFKDYASDTFRDIVSDMLRTIVLDKVVGNLDEQIAAVYEEYSAGKISEADLLKKVAEITQGMIGNYEENIPVLENLLNNVSDILKEAGIDIKQDTGGVNQQPTSGALTTMSQDSISTFEGIGRSMQTHLISIDNTALEIKAAMVADNEALMQIVENTSHILPIREILEKLDREGIKVQ